MGRKVISPKPFCAVTKIEMAIIIIRITEFLIKSFVVFCSF